MKYTIDTLAVELKNIQIQLSKLDATIVNVANSFVSKDIFDLRMKDYDKQIASINLEISRVEKEAKKGSWKSHTLTAVFTAVLVFLVTFVVNELISIGG